MDNHANYKGSSVGVSASAAANFDTPFGDRGIAQSQKQALNENGEPLYQAEGIYNTHGYGEKVLAHGKESATGNLSVGVGSDKNSQSSQTTSGINTQNLIIRDKQGQLEKTGKTAAQMKEEVKTDITTDNAESRSGKLENKFDKDKVLKELNIQVKVTQEFRKNAFATIDAYVLPKQAELREKVKFAKTEAEKDELYKEIYKLQYQKRLLETTVGIIAGTPDVAITQGTLQLAATKMREETLKNSRLFKGVYEINPITGKLEKRMDNVSYGSGYFDGVKLGGVRIELDVICGSDRCQTNDDGSVVYKGSKELPSLLDAINPDKNKPAFSLYGETGGLQSIEGGWYWGGKPLFTYKPGDKSDFVIECFAGTHDYLGGQLLGWYNKQGNTLENKNAVQTIGAEATTILALPVAAPFAVSDLFSPDMMEVLFKLGGQQ